MRYSAAQHEAVVDDPSATATDEHAEVTVDLGEADRGTPTRRVPDRPGLPTGSSPWRRLAGGWPPADTTGVTRIVFALTFLRS